MFNYGVLCSDQGVNKKDPMTNLERAIEGCGIEAKDDDKGGPRNTKQARAPTPTFLNTFQSVHGFERGYGCSWIAFRVSLKYLMFL